MGSRFNKIDLKVVHISFWEYSRFYKSINFIRCVAIAICVTTLFFACDSDIYRPLAGGYYYVSLGGPNAVITNPEMEGEIVIPCTIVQYGYDEYFIVAKNEYTNQCAWEVIDDQTTKGVIQYWVIQVQDKKLYGPLTKSNYLGVRDSLKIPPALSLDGIDSKN